MRIENKKKLFLWAFSWQYRAGFWGTLWFGSEVLQCEIRIANDNRIVRVENCCCGLHKLDTFRLNGWERLRVRDLTSSFFAYSQNIDSPESFILPFFTRKVSTVTFSEGGCTLSWSQNDKTFNSWYLVSATSTFSLKVVVEWRRLPPFRAKMTLVHSRALRTVIARKSRTRSRTRLRI